jgi:hypothetical protein
LVIADWAIFVSAEFFLIKKPETMRLLSLMIPLLISVIFFGNLNAQIMPFKFKYKGDAFQAFDIKDFQVIDKRPELRNLGYIKTPLGGPYVPVMLEDSLNVSLQKFFMAQISPKSDGVDLLLHIRKFSFTEYNQKPYQYGFFRFRAEFFKALEDGYQLLGKIDTLVEVKGSDPTQRMFKAANQTLFLWLENSLALPVKDEKSWPLSLILDIEKTEKSNIPLFKAKQVPNGLYASYASLANLSPDDRDTEVHLPEESDLLFIIKKDHKGEKQIVPSQKDGYAIAHENKLWMLTPTGYSRVYARNGNLYFQAPVRELVITNAMSPLFMFGALGGSIAMATSEGKTELITYQIDHINGGWTPVRKGSY